MIAFGRFYKYVPEFKVGNQNFDMCETQYIKCLYPLPNNRYECYIPRSTRYADTDYYTHL